MGGGRWDSVSYNANNTTMLRKAKLTGRSYADVAFDYSNSEQAQVKKQVHPSLDPARINKKPFQKLESRDSAEHPESIAIMLCFDVTGSNYSNAVVAQQKLGGLMDMLNKYIADPQLAIAANDDFKVQRERCIQISDFESDNRVDNHIKNTILVRDGGGNMGESYDLLLYAAARKTVLDCVEKRGKKGYLFFYADEPFMKEVDKDEVSYVFGDDLKKDIKIEKMIEEAQQLYNVFVIWPENGYVQARDQYVKLFGKSNVLTLQDPALICELVGSVIAINEEKIGSSADMQKELLAVGTSKEDAKRIIDIASKIKRKFKFDDMGATGD